MRSCCIFEAHGLGHVSIATLIRTPQDYLKPSHAPRRHFFVRHRRNHHHHHHHSFLVPFASSSSQPPQDRFTKTPESDILPSSSSLPPSPPLPQPSTTAATPTPTTPKETAQPTITTRTPRWPSSSWPRSASSPPLCRECRGRGVVPSAAGPLPCPSCLAWRRRPDYRPNRPLVSIKDLDLRSLETIRQQQQGSDEERERTSEEAQAQAQQRRKARGQMTEEKRLAIKLAMQGRGPHSSDHKRRISNAMRERYAADPSLRQSGRPKRCGLCGGIGHNSRGCPEYDDDDKECDDDDKEYDDDDENDEEYGSEVSSETEEEGNTVLDGVLTKLRRDGTSSGGKKRRGGGQRACSVCGEVGHNKRSCPQLTMRQRQQQRQQPQKMIVIEEDKEEDKEGTRRVDVRSEKNGEAQSESNGVLSVQEPSPNGNGEEEQQQQEQLEEVLAAAALVLDEELSVSSSKSTTNTTIPQQQSKQLRLIPGSECAITDDGVLVFSLPSSPEECVAQAAGAVLRAWGDGIRRQSLELLLPQAPSDGAAGWPGGIRQQFRAALPMVESLLLKLKKSEGLEGRITAEWLDEGDCVGAWQSERLASVMFPTADTLPAVRRIDDALSGNRLMLVVNAQWQPQGQIVSDFGFGQSKKAAERYVASLEPVYYLRRVRVLGDEIRVLRCFPAKWQVHYIRTAGESELLAVEEERPTYERLMELLQGTRGSRASKSWLDRALDRGWYDDIAAYTEGKNNNKGRGGGGPGSAAARGVMPEEGEEEDEVIRDIVTGAVVKVVKKKKKEEV